MKECTILAVDPGTLITGFGIVQFLNNQLFPLDYGCVRPPAKFKISERYLIIFDALNALIDKFKPNVVVVETQYVKENVQSALKLGMAKGTVILAARKNGLCIFGYSPSKAKLAVTGTGKASKHQVQEMVKKLLNLKNTLPEDAADALALAICHFHYLQTSRTSEYEI
ncbi:Crossover junction endodeoxyribonuclease RuvC [Chlamydiales bacterium STE3]|nr:Crossover junction endodeoxyribonuclease RuvC [Chlamydiales bacterium STE3]